MQAHVWQVFSGAMNLIAVMAVTHFARAEEEMNWLVFEVRNGSLSMFCAEDRSNLSAQTRNSCQANPVNEIVERRAVQWQSVDMNTSGHFPERRQ